MTTLYEKLRGFYGGRLYPVAVALLILIGHVLGQELILGAALIALILPACFVCHDLRFAVQPFLCVIFIVSAKGYSPNDTGYDERFFNPISLVCIGVLAVLLVASLVWFAVRNRKFVNRVSWHGMLPGIVILSVSLLFNGLFSKHYTPKNLFFATVFAITVAAVYLFFAFYFRFDEKSGSYLAYCLVVAAMLIVAELLAAYLTHVEIVNGEINKGTVVLGWGVWTNIGGMLAFLMPACFYFAATHRHGWIGYLLGFFTYFGILLSQSRGALLIGSVGMLLSLIVLCFFGENRKRNRIYTLVVIAVGLIGCAVLWDKVLGLVQNFLQYGFADNGRFAKWTAGWNHFLQYPVFGSGFYDSYVDAGWEMPVYPYLYHNTVIQLLGAGGVVAFLAYAYHRFCTVRLVFRRPNLQKTFFGICILSLLLFSLTDVLLFKTYPTIYYALMLLFMEKSESAETV